MRRLLGFFIASPFVLIVALFLGACQTTQSTAPQGDIHISAQVAAQLMGWFENQQPGSFAVSTDGRNSFGTYCPQAQQCLPGREMTLKECRRARGRDCVILAELSKIRWNGRVTAPRPRDASVLAQIQFRGSTAGSLSGVSGYLPISSADVVRHRFSFRGKDCEFVSDLNDGTWSFDCGPTLTIEGPTTGGGDFYYGFGRGSNGETFKLRIARFAYLEDKGVEFVDQARAATETASTRETAYYMNFTSRDLCQVAVARRSGKILGCDKADWTQSHVREAKRRGYTLEDCVKHIEGAG